MVIPSICSSCIQGYTFVQGSCINNFNFGISITFNSSIANFISNYNNLLSLISNSVEQPQNSIFVSSISYNQSISSNQIFTFNFNLSSNSPASRSSTMQSNLVNSLSQISGANYTISANGVNSIICNVAYCITCNTTNYCAVCAFGSNNYYGMCQYCYI